MPDNYFDFVFSVSVMEHVPIEEWGRCFEDITRVVKTGGIIFHAIDCCMDSGNQLLLAQLGLPVTEMADALDELTKIGSAGDIEPLDPTQRITLDDIIKDPCALYLSPVVWNIWRKIDTENRFFSTFRRVTSLNVAYRKTRSYTTSKTEPDPKDV